MPKWAWVSYSVKERGGQNSSGPFSINTVPHCLMVKARLHWVNVYLTIREEEAQHEREHGEAAEIMSYYQPPYLHYSHRSLEPRW